MHVYLCHADVNVFSPCMLVMVVTQFLFTFFTRNFTLCSFCLFFGGKLRVTRTQIYKTCVFIYRTLSIELSMVIQSKIRRAILAPSVVSRQHYLTAYKRYITTVSVYPCLRIVFHNTRHVKCLFTYLLTMVLQPARR